MSVPRLRGGGGRPASSGVAITVGAARGAPAALDVSRLRGREAPWITRLRAVDEEFDAQHRVKTGGIVHLNDLGISAAYDYARLAVPYVPSDPSVVRRALAALPLRREDFTFIDFGSGLPVDPLVLYLYHPFGAEIMRVVGDRVRRSLEQNPRDVFVIYNNPVTLDVWTEGGFQEIARDDEFAILRGPDLAAAV